MLECSAVVAKSIKAIQRLIALVDITSVISAQHLEPVVLVGTHGMPVRSA